MAKLFKAITLMICVAAIPSSIYASSISVSFSGLSGPNGPYNTEVLPDDLSAAESGVSLLIVDKNEDGWGFLSDDQAAFIFTNTGDFGITDIMLEDGVILSIGYLIDKDDADPNDILGDSNVDYSPGTTKGLPSSFDFAPTAAWGSDPDNGPGGVSNGIQQGEQLVIVYNLKPDVTMQDIEDALNVGQNTGGTPPSLRIALHVQQLAGGTFADGSSATTSAWLLNDPPGGFDDDEIIVPEPASIFLFGLGTLGMGVLARRRRQTEEPELV